MTAPNLLTLDALTKGKSFFLIAGPCVIESEEHALKMAKAAVAAGIDGLFMEVHDNPEKALSDASTQFSLAELDTLLATLVRIRAASAVQ